MSSDVNEDLVDDLFAQAIDIPIDERSTFLLAASDGNEAVLAEVSKLLLAHERAASDPKFLADPPSDERFFRNVRLSQDPLIGERIGPYKIIRRIGAGGFGHVYLALRIDDYRQKVAVKVLRSDIVVNDRTLARFELERQLLADLQHEHIARLLDGGALANGRPYIVMEYVKGVPITDFCDNQRLSVAQRLTLFLSVCEAVAYAHRFGVIHRDIKPDNLHVTGEGSAKLLDFGIAKMVDPISQKRMVTISEDGMPKTPEYASPEQIRSEGISTASDVYSLGVVLYELLAGRRPYEFVRGTAAEFERVVCDVRPRKPSAVVLEPHQLRSDDDVNTVRTAEIIADRRATSPADLSSQLKGDLDQIILMALRKEPKGRYQSVDSFADDLNRFSRGETVVARPTGNLERAWRWAKRHRAVSALTAGLILVTLGSLAAITWQLYQRVEAQKRLVNAQVDLLLKATDESVPYFVSSLQEFSEYSTERLRTLYRQEHLPRKERVRIALALLRSDPRLADELAAQLGDATPGEVRIICDELDQLSLRPPRLRDLLQHSQPPASAGESELDKLAQQRANLAIAQARLGAPGPLWTLLRSSPDNSVRSHIIDRWGVCGGGATLLVERLSQRETSVDERRALVLTLGSIPDNILKGAERDKLVISLDLFGQFERASDAGLHAALRWLLCRWGHVEEVRNIESRLAGNPNTNANWYVTVGGQTMTILGPDTFQMGSPPSEQERELKYEQIHVCHIDRRFAIAEQEVTVAQFTQFKKLVPIGGPDSLEPDCPARLISWSDAAAYCNELSRRSIIPRDQWCYEADAGNAGYRPANDYLNRTGFRLPTEAEWEYACRAGTKTPRFYGYSLELLPQYAQCLRRDPTGRKGPVAALLPNDFGLFDVYGNATEWCNDQIKEFEAAPPVSDRGGPSWTTDNPLIILRGMASGDVVIPRSALRNRARYLETHPAVGFRIARTETVSQSLEHSEDSTGAE